MAEIRVQEKKGPSPWLWIIGLLAVAVLIWLFTGLSGDDDEFASETGETIDTIAAPADPGIVGGTAIEDETGAEVEDYLAFVRETNAVDVAGREHAYVVEGLRKLTAALDADAGLETVREAVDRLEESEADATVHAGLTRDAFLAVTASMESMAADDATALRQAAEAIQSDQPLLDQTAEVEAFFTTAAELLSGATTS